MPWTINNWYFLVMSTTLNMLPIVETIIFKGNVWKMCKLCNKTHGKIPSVDYDIGMHFTKKQDWPLHHWRSDEGI